MDIEAIESMDSLSFSVSIHEHCEGILYDEGTPPPQEKSSTSKIFNPLNKLLSKKENTVD